jgi:predicted enzyme related to lactoylglutathione lyase
MRIRLNSVPVGDQAHALAFYTERLGFVKKEDIPMGEFRWLTVVSPDDPEGAELVLEPTAFPPSKTYQAELYEAGIPCTAFEVDDIESEFKSLSDSGVHFKGEPTDAGGAIIAVFDDTCGNFIQIYQATGGSS